AHGRQGVRGIGQRGAQAHLRRDQPARAHALQDRPAHALLGEIGRLPAAGDDPVPGRAARSRRGIPEASVIRWGAPHLLVLLVAVPIVLLLVLAAAWLKRMSLARLADPGLIPRLT